jgi:signal transduction histidine kinase
MRQHDQHLAFVTHDLRTPLNAIALAVEVLVLSVSVPQDSVAARMLRVLRRNVRQLHKQVDDVLAASAAPHAGTPLTVHRRCFELWPLVEQLVHELELLAQTSDTRLVNAVPDELEVSADAKLLTRALRNLVENAIRHAPRGEIVIGAERIGSGVACWVNDNGGGIIATPLEKVFEEAETTNGGGMGLGLAIVRQIVEAHGGRIAVARKPGRGTTFRFDLPAEAPDAA